MNNNPFIVPLSLNRETLFNEFKTNLRKRVFRWVLVFVEKEAYQKGVFDLIGTWCWGDVMDFKPPGDLANLAAFDTVPTKSQVRLYMRHKTMINFFHTNPNTKEGQWIYGGTFGIVPKYQGTRGLSEQMSIKSLEFADSMGYTLSTGHAINEIAKAVFRRGHNFSEIPVDVSGMLVDDTKTYPFKGLNLT